MTTTLQIKKVGDASYELIRVDMQILQSTLTTQIENMGLVILSISSKEVQTCPS